MCPYFLNLNYRVGFIRFTNLLIFFFPTQTKTVSTQRRFYSSFEHKFSVSPDLPKGSRSPLSRWSHFGELSSTQRQRKKFHIKTCLKIAYFSVYLSESFFKMPLHISIWKKDILSNLLFKVIVIFLQVLLGSSYLQLLVEYGC